MRALVETTRSRSLVLIAVLLGAGFLLLGAFMLERLSAAGDQLDGLRAQQTDQSKIIGNLSSGLTTAEQQLAQHGIKPLPPPPAQIIQQGAVGPPGPGPSDAQVLEAVTQYLTAHPLPTAPPPGPQEIAATVAEYLKANPVLPGKDGAPGLGASDGQVANAVATYLEVHPPADGTPGPAGPSGPSGPAGIGEPGPAGPSGPVGKDGEQGSPGPAGPACPSGYSQAPETVNGHQAVVCEATPTPPTSSPPSSPASPSPAGVVVPLLFGWLTIPRDQRKR